MEPATGRIEGEGSDTYHQPGERPVLAGVQVREEDFEPQRGLHVAGVVFRVAAAVVLALALFQFAYWWLNRPPGGAGLGVLIGDTIRLVVFAALLWAAGELAALLIQTHYDVRAARILIARQTYMMRQMGRARGELAPEQPDGARRATDAA